MSVALRPSGSALLLRTINQYKCPQFWEAATQQSLPANTIVCISGTRPKRKPTFFSACSISERRSAVGTLDALPSRSVHQDPPFHGLSSGTSRAPLDPAASCSYSYINKRYCGMSHSHNASRFASQASSKRARREQAKVALGWFRRDTADRQKEVLLIGAIQERPKPRFKDRD